MYSIEDRTTAKKQLPVVLQSFIDSKELASVYEEIKKTYVLNLRQMGALIECLEDVLVGLTPKESLSQRLAQALPELPQDAREKILSDVEEKIFKQAREKVLS